MSKVLIQVYDSNHLEQDKSMLPDDYVRAPQIACNMNSTDRAADDILFAAEAFMIPHLHHLAIIQLYANDPEADYRVPRRLDYL
ncbi:hypothetical protein CHS0354_041108 [Potamilus streckersoni]|uniref:Uncharacterized protein n=1 Tax=Potamilus streckersoni TaxID=2493646 RepID=A0AAE0VU03_9BIVA|nr:hypothetical protein CHS0354_041108 [Potamilus streckersoni]